MSGGRPKRNRKDKSGAHCTSRSNRNHADAIDITGDNDVNIDGNDDSTKPSKTKSRKRSRPYDNKNNGMVDVEGKNEEEEYSSRGDESGEKCQKLETIEKQPEKLQEQSLLNTHPHAQLPAYLAEAFSDLYAEDGLLVMGRGLGWLSLLAVFVRFYADVENGYWADRHGEENGNNSNNTNSGSSSNNPPKSPPQTKQIRQTKPPLIFVLNLRENERTNLLSILSSWGAPPSQLPILVTNESGQSKERAAMYARGGVFVITSRILIVDLLTGVANARDVEGILVGHAERCGEKSTEAFILRIFRSQRYMMEVSGRGDTNAKGGFIKAFTDDPSSLMSGFAKIDKILKALQVPNLYLYPRFHATIAEELESFPPQVEELHQSLSPKMMEIQACIASAVRSCLRELRKASPLVDISVLFGNDGRRKRRRRDANSNDETSSQYNAAPHHHHGESTQNWEITLEQCISLNFDTVFSRQLEGDWHTLNYKARSILQDLRTLKKLFHHLIHFDAIQFLRVLENIKAMSVGSGSSSNKYLGGHTSMWLLTPAAERLFQLAKERVYQIVGEENTRRVIPRLEVNPKEKLLEQVLTEVENRWYAKQSHINSQDENQNDDDHSVASTSSNNVLLMVKDEHTLEYLRTFLIRGEEWTTSIKWLRYLDHVNTKSRSMVRTIGGGIQALPAEQQLLLGAEGTIRKKLFGVDRDRMSNVHGGFEGQEESKVQQDRMKEKQELDDWKKRHRKMAEEKARGEEKADFLKGSAHLEEAVEEMRRGCMVSLDMDTMFDTIDCENNLEDEKVIGASKRKREDDGEYSSSDEEDDLFYKVHPIEGLTLFIRTLSKLEEGDAGLLLRDLRPNTVIMYDSDPSFIRTLEIYANSLKPPTIDNSKPMSSVNDSATTQDQENDNKDDRLRVFFLLYENTVEETNFLQSLEKENQAFERLIDHKKRMPFSMPTFNNFSTQEMQNSHGGYGGSYAGGSLPLSMDTRSGRGKQSSTKERRDIAVDVREFRSALPSILHHGGMRLAPVTLTVGDFVLSNVHCVERKSISDLYQSFASGRLYTQAESMSKHYKCPCLLIEFDPDKNFSLQNVNELGNEIRTDSICSKITLLAMHFPKLRYLWSRSEHETLKLFKKLKRNHQEVDVDKAVEIGTNDSLDDLLFGGAEECDEEDGNTNDEVNEAAKRMLLRLPGVNVHNARKIMNECNSIADLAELSREELKRIAGPVAGQKLFTFFRQPFTT